MKQVRCRKCDSTAYIVNTKVNFDADGEKLIITLSCDHETVFVMKDGKSNKELKKHSEYTG